MHTREQLAAEWSHDARALLRGGADDARALRFINRVGAGSWSSDVSDASEIGCADESSDVGEEPTAVPVFPRRAYASAGSSPHPPLDTAAPSQLRSAEAAGDADGDSRGRARPAARGRGGRARAFRPWSTLESQCSRRAAPILERAGGARPPFQRLRAARSQREFLSALLAEAAEPSAELPTRLVVLELARALIAARRDRPEAARGKTGSRTSPATT